MVKRGPKAKFFEQVKAYKVLDVAARKGQPWETEVQVMSLGRELAWVALGGEVFVELGLSIKAASPFQQTHVVELANGSFSYIPNRSAYAEGNYEVISARCAEGSGEMHGRGGHPHVGRVGARGGPGGPAAEDHRAAPLVRLSNFGERRASATVRRAP